MKVTAIALPGVLQIEPTLLGDKRGFFVESFNLRDFNQATGLDVAFVQDNHSRSAQGVLRGLHYQVSPHAQGKLVRVLRGAIFDVVVDIRPSSPAFGQWMGLEMSEDDGRQLWVPPGFAHGFLTLSDHADVFYKTTAYYEASCERRLAWDDATVGVRWPLKGPPVLSAKDAAGFPWKDIGT